MVSLEVMILTMASFLAGLVPPAGVSPLEVLGLEESITPEFLTGTWHCSDNFVRWDVADIKERRSIRLRNKCHMILRSDGSMQMIDLFRPEHGRWKLSDQGLLIDDPAHPSRGWQAIPVRKRGAEGIWLFLPFSGGATGIGMERVKEDPSLGEDLPSGEKNPPRRSH